jgi:hypothetical protein
MYHSETDLLVKWLMEGKARMRWRKETGEMGQRRWDEGEGVKERG